MSMGFIFPKIDTHGDFRLPANGIRQITAGEVQSQVYDNTSLFTGTDGQGTHAKIYIDDKETRVHLGFETDDKDDKQEVVTVERIKQILGYKTQKPSKKMFKKKFYLSLKKLSCLMWLKKKRLMTTLRLSSLKNTLDLNLILNHKGLNLDYL